MANLEQLKTELTVINYQLGRLNLRHVSPDRMTDLTARVTELYNRAKESEDLEAKQSALAAKLGGRAWGFELGLEKNQKFITFLKANGLQHQIHALHLHVEKVDGALAMPLCLDGERVDTSFNSLREIPRMEEGKQVGYTFQNADGRVVFETDMKYKLTEDFSMCEKGLRPYHPGKHGREVEVLPYDHQDPAKWGHQDLLEITVFYGKPTNHTAFRLFKSDGSMISVGQYTKIYSPEEMYLFPPGHLKADRKTFRLSPDEMSRVLKHIEEEKHDPDYHSQVLQKNCTSLLRRVIQVVPDIKVDPTISSMDCLMRTVLPEPMHKKLTQFGKWLDQTLPKWAVNVLHFFPIYYIPTTLALLGFKGVSELAARTINEVYRAHDLTLTNIFFRPWRVRYDSPDMLAEQIREYESERVVPNPKV